MSQPACELCGSIGYHVSHQVLRNSGRWSYKTNTIGCSARMNNSPMNEPVVIQGGMGAGVSNWRLAQAVSRLGQLGLVSGTALDQILARRLQDGDSGGHIRR